MCVWFQWEVGASVLGILYKLLSTHQVAPEDFMEQVVEVQGEGATVTNKPPGHSILLHMLNDSPMLRMVRVVVYTQHKPLI